MVYIALKSVNITSHAITRSPRAAFYAVSQAAFILNTVTSPRVVSVNTLFVRATKMMRTMTSMMINMPLKGVR